MRWVTDGSPETVRGSREERDGPGDREGEMVEGIVRGERRDGAKDREGRAGSRELRGGAVAKTRQIDPD